MGIKKVNITTAKSQLSLLLKQLEEQNEEIIIERGNKPIARIVKYKADKKFQRIGKLKNQINVLDDFNSLPSDIASIFGME